MAYTRFTRLPKVQAVNEPTMTIVQQIEHLAGFVISRAFVKEVQYFRTS